MSIKSLLLSAGLIGLIAGHASAASVCYKPEEAQAVQVRQFHARLQVAALKCSDPGWGIQDRYNTYVSRFGGTLSTNAKSLRAALSRTGVAKTDAQFDRFITRISNDLSNSAPSSVEYCQQHLAMLDEVLAGGPDKFSQLAMTYEPVPSGSSVCPSKNEVKSADAAPVKTKKTPAAKKAPAKKEAAKPAKG